MNVVPSKLIAGSVAGAIAKIPQGMILFLFSELNLLYVRADMVIRTPLEPWYWIKHVIWGAIFGVFLGLNLLATAPGWVRGLVVGLIHAAGTLLVVNPLVDGGFMWLDMGLGFPVIVVGFNLLWGLLAGVGMGLWDWRGSKTEAGNDEATKAPPKRIVKPTAGKHR